MTNDGQWYKEQTGCQFRENDKWVGWRLEPLSRGESGKITFKR